MRRQHLAYYTEYEDARRAKDKAPPTDALQIRRRKSRFELMLRLPGPPPILKPSKRVRKKYKRRAYVDS